ncbi:MAG: DUF4129 domain-containing protein, partial [Anaerolineales bacterium]
RAMINVWHNTPGRDSNIREPDDYLERKEKPPTLPPAPPWVENFLQPAVIGVMVACLSQSIAELMRQISPGWHHQFFLIAPILAALAGYATYRTIQKRLISGTESLRYQIFELVLIFVLCKITTHLTDTLPELTVKARGWFTDPVTFMDGETLLMFVLCATAWLAAAATGKDLFTISDPTLYIGEKNPMHRISTRYFIGGIILLITTAFSQVDLVDVLQLERPRVPGLLLGVLIYFMLGLFMLGQLNYRRHAGYWIRQKVHISAGFSTIGLRYSLLFLAGITLIALILPTGYSISLLDLVRTIINYVFFLMNLIFIIISYPFLLLLSLLSRNSDVEMPVMETPAPIQPPEVSAPGSPNPWLEILRSLLFWLIALGALGYILRGYLRDHPEIFASFRKLTPVKWLFSLLRALKSFFRRMKATVEAAMPGIVNRLRRRPGSRSLSSRRRKGHGYRERIFDHYLDTLDVAQAEGLARKSAQTPYEYKGVLEPKLNETSPEMTRLTATFVEARYSQHPFGVESADQAGADARTVQDALRTLKDNPDTDL